MRAVSARALARSAGPTALLALLAAAPPCAASQEQLAAGQATYEKYCAQCHGDKGDGRGPAAAHLQPKPRDFTTGKYKLRTTPSGALPTDDDIRKVIRQGMPATSMPGWPQLSEAEVAGLVAYLKSFHAGFADPSAVPRPIELPKAPAFAKAAADKGREIYASLGCARCHGDSGRGEGPSAPTLRDDKGDPIRAADLTERWTFRGGPTREDIFRTFSTGLNGTPMPSFFDSLQPEDRWALTDYVYSLGEADEPGYASVIVAAPLEEELDLSRADALFAAARPARLPVVGQIMEPGRAFAPSATSLVVRAVYDQQRIAFQVRWHDARADVVGRNDPGLEVPVAEEEPAPAAASAAEGNDFWGEETAAPAAESAAAQPAADFWGEEAAPVAAATGSEFADAIALQLPAQTPEGTARPYFLFGDGQLPVDLWFFDLAQKRPRQFVGKGGAGLAALAGGEVLGQGSYAAGEWTAVFVRELRSPSGVSFREGAYLPIAFSVWDGTARERGSRRGLTQWFHLYLPPRDTPSVLAPLAGSVGIVLVLELLLVAAIRRRQPGTGAPGAQGGGRAD